MKTNYKLPFDIMGIPINLHISFLIFLPVLAWLIGRQIDFYIELLNLGINPSEITQGTNAFLVGLFAAVGLFIGVTLHELGHSLVGISYGVKVESITLYVLGGVAQLEEIPSRPGEEAKMALAGPATSFALGGIFWLLLTWANPAGAVPRFMLGYLFYVNIAVGIFNLVPALPLDGGRVLRSLISLRKSHFEATKIATQLSKFLAVLMGIYGLLSFNIILLVIAFYIYSGVVSEFRNVVLDRALAGFTTGDLMTRDVVTVDPEISVEELKEFMVKKRHLGYPVVKNDDVIGIVTLEDLQKSEDPNEPIENVLTREVITIDKDQPAIEAFHMIVDNELGRLVVTDGSGNMVGIITRTDIMNAMKVVMVSSPGGRSG